MFVARGVIEKIIFPLFNRCSFVAQWACLYAVKGVASRLNRHAIAPLGACRCAIKVARAVAHGTGDRVNIVMC